jgi:gliding motility-associated-like protein
MAGVYTLEINGTPATTATVTVEVISVPADATAITGSAVVCQGQTAVAYDVAAISSATSYIWTFPSGATGSGTTNSITADYSASALSGSITVQGSNICGTGAISSLPVTVNPLVGPPGTLSGPLSVCQGQSSVIYTVTDVLHVSTYSWTLPSGATGSSVTNTISVDFGTSAVSGLVSVKAVNSCGEGTASTLSVTVNPLPVAAGTITGISTVCQSQSSVVYSVPAITGASTYVWTLPAGATGTSTTSSITVNYGVSAISGNITVKGNNSCGDGVVSTLPITVNPLPDAAGTITGAPVVCQGQSSVIYTVPTIGNASSYIWTLPSGATGTSITNSISVNFDNTAVTGNITVKGSNSCGFGTASIHAITINPLPSTPGSITGKAAVCQGEASVSYSVLPVSYATSYIWTLPTGASGSSTNNTITVSYSNSAVSGSITVKGNNTCGDGPVSTLPVSVDLLPVAAGTITGNSTVCQGQSSVVYSVPSITNATSYTWTLPSGATGISTTNSITVNYGATAVSGNISVKGTNACGDGIPSTHGITVNPLPLAAGTIAGLATVCQGQASVIYSVPAITNAVSYIWSLPSGTTGTSTTNSITVSYGTSSASGAVTVKGLNACGEGIASSLGITVNPLPAAAGIITGSATVCQGQVSVTYNVPVISNATSYIWTLPLGSTGTSTTNTIIVNYGLTAVSGTITVKGNNTCGDGTFSSLPITVNPLTGAAGTIIGSTTVCQGQASVVYTVPAIDNATSYIWTLPAGATGTSSTNSISVTYGSSSVSGNVTVAGSNTCGDGTASLLFVTVNPLPLPAGAITGSTPVCQGQSAVTYTVPIITNATSYIWALPSGATGTSITNTITVNFSNSAVSGNISVKGNNNCGDGAVSLFPVVVNSLPTPTLISSDPDNSFCSGTSVTFTAGGGTLYNFRVAGSSVQSGVSNTYTTTSLSNGKAVDVIVTNINSCTAVSSSIINFVDPLPFIFISSAPVCSASLLTYSLAVAVSSGTVTSTSGTVSNTGGNAWAITGVPAGTNITVSVTDGNTCENTLAVTAPNCTCPVIQAPVSSGDKSYCEGGSVPVLSATVQSGETIDWYNDASGGSVLRSSSLSYNPSTQGTYYALARNATTGCVSSTRTAIKVTMYVLPVPTLVSTDPDNSFCAGTSVTFTAGGGTGFNFRVGGISVQNGLSATFTTSSLTYGQTVDVIVSNDNGCTAVSSVITNNVVPNPVARISSTDSDNKICAGSAVTFYGSGGSDYNFRIDGISVQNGLQNSYTTNTLTDGQAIDVIVTSNGCVSTSPAITNSVLPVPAAILTSSDSDNIFCSGSVIIFTSSGGINYDYRINGDSKQGGSLPTYSVNTLVNGDKVDVRITGLNGCNVITAPITNTVNAVPVANAGRGGNECDLNFSLVALPSIGAGTWTKAAGSGTAVFTPNASSPTATVTVSEYGNYSFTWTELNSGCSSSSNVTVNFYERPIANPGTGGNNCGPGFLLNAVPSVGIGTWTKTAGTGTVSFNPNSNTPNATVTVSAFGQYTFTWTEVNGTCSNSASINVNFFKVPSANAGRDTTLCGLELTLAAIPGAGAGGGIWTKFTGPGNASFTPDANKANSKVTVTLPGLYEFLWTETNSSCQSSDKVIALFYDKPPISAGRDTVICKGSFVQLAATGIGLFNWSPVSLLNDPYISNPVATPLGTTIFKATITDDRGCTNADSMEVAVIEIPVAVAGPDQTLNYVFNTSVSAQPPGVNETGFWSLVLGSAKIASPSNTTTNLTGLAPGENRVLWTVSNDVCPPSLDFVTIIVNDFVVPTLITPNMDGKNDYFVLPGLATLGKTKLTVFDRKGIQVFSNNNYDNKWNGVDKNGDQLPNDTYFYTLKAENGVSKSGYIVIR